MIIEFWNQYGISIITSVIAVINGLIIQKLIQKSLERLNQVLKGFMERLLTIITWLIISTIILASFGVNVTGLITGLGLAGVIAGFALQDPLKNIASGIFIFIYKPFKISDFVKIQDVQGEVIKMGLAATTLKTVEKVIITIPNSRVWDSMIHNYTKNPVRLLNLKLEVLYENSLDKVIKLVNDLLDKEERVKKNNSREVLVTNLESGSVVLRVRGDVNNQDYLTVKRDLLKNLKTTLMNKGIELGDESTISLRK